MADILFEDNLKTRFTPHPTGMMQIGNYRTALYNYFLAKSSEGKFLFRVEDTDPEYSDERYTNAIMDDLKWMGLSWNEGVGVGGDLGPYHESKRQAIYEDYYERLKATKSAYPCFCSDEELANMRRLQRAQGKAPRYLGHCRDLCDVDVAAKLAQGLKPALRFRVPENEAVEFTDLICGAERIMTDDIGDFVIQRADGIAPSLFSNAIDDALMEITHVLRSEDHFSNTPRQILLLNALGLNIPVYIHMAMIIGSDDSPLSKRNGSQTIDQLRRGGYLPLAINNYVARLGHFYGHDEICSLDELVEQFKIENLNKTPAKFSVDQLGFWQGEAIAHLDNATFWTWVGDDIKNSVPEAMREEFFQAVQPEIRFPRDVQHWVDVIFGDVLEIQSDLTSILDSTKKAYFSEILRAVNMHGGNLRKIVDHLRYTLHVEGRDIFTPLRVALTGELHGPELEKILHLMDQQEIKRRLEKVRTL